MLKIVITIKIYFTNNFFLFYLLRFDSKDQSCEEPSQENNCYYSNSQENKSYNISLCIINKQSQCISLEY